MRLPPGGDTFWGLSDYSSIAPPHTSVLSQLPLQELQSRHRNQTGPVNDPPKPVKPSMLYQSSRTRFSFSTHWALCVILLPEKRKTQRNLNNLETGPLSRSTRFGLDTGPLLASNYWFYFSTASLSWPRCIGWEFVATTKHYLWEALLIKTIDRYNRNANTRKTQYCGNAGKKEKKMRNKRLNICTNPTKAKPNDLG